MVKFHLQVIGITGWPETAPSCLRCWTYQLMMSMTPYACDTQQPRCNTTANEKTLQSWLRPHPVLRVLPKQAATKETTRTGAGIAEPSKLSGLHLSLLCAWSHRVLLQNPTTLLVELRATPQKNQKHHKPEHATLAAIAYLTIKYLTPTFCSSEALELRCVSREPRPPQRATGWGAKETSRRSTSQRSTKRSIQTTP